MDTIKKFKNGGNRALHLPKRFQPEGKEFQIANEVPPGFGCLLLSY